jgi:hypothetical protein
MKRDFKGIHYNQKNIGLLKFSPTLEINFPVNCDVHQSCR